MRLAEKMTLNCQLIALLLTIGCGAGQSSPSNSNGPQTPVQGMICQSPNVPTFTNIPGSSNWIYFNGQTYTPYIGSCVPGGR